MQKQKENNNTVNPKVKLFYLIMGLTPFGSTITATVFVLYWEHALKLNIS